MRYRNLILVLAGVTLCAAGVIGSGEQNDRITSENYDRLTQGMTQTEVVAILGPPGDYSSVPMQVSGMAYCGSDIRLQQTWQGDQGEITLEFSGDSVVFKHFCPSVPLKRSQLEILLWRARRLWHRWGLAS
jgi:hypothetical protein